MRLSSLADYAVVMMAAAARHGPDARLSATDLSTETGVPLPTAQKLMGRLTVAGLLASTRGTGGGFTLARPSAAITLADIVEAVEGRIALTSCVEDGKHDCVLEGACKVKPHWALVNEAVRSAFADVPLDRLAGVSRASVAQPVRAEPVEAPTPRAALEARPSTGSGRTARVDLTEVSIA
jgi:FeS assembly SUF system regulator